MPGLRLASLQAKAVSLLLLGIAGVINADELVQPDGCDCSAPSLKVVAWCGADGEWYQNACIGFCAGVAPGNRVCDGSTMPFVDLHPGPNGAESNGGAANTISEAIVNAFKEEGFRYMGRIRLARDLGGRLSSNATVTPAEDPALDASGKWNIRAVRCTSEGDVYVGSMDIAPSSNNVEGFTPPWLNTQKKRGGPNSRGSSSSSSGSSEEAGDSDADSEGDAASTAEAGIITSSIDEDSKAIRLRQDEACKGFSIIRPIKSMMCLANDLAENFLSWFSRSSNRAKPSSSSSSAEVSGGGRHRRRRRLASAAAEGVPGHSRSLQEIIASDDRKVCSTRAFPYTAIGQIQVVDSSGMYICTGTLIKPDKVLTAAHCVWNTRRNAFYFNLNFAPGRYNENGKIVNPWGVVPWKSVTILDAFKKNPSTWDVAVVTLQKPLGSLTGFMGMAAGCSNNLEVTVTGYPQDQAQGTCMSTQCTQRLNCDMRTNSHTCDTVMGMSGSPLWDSKNRIRMIHVAGIEGRQENRATTLTEYLVNAVNNW